jgi:hypothetical protein
MRVAGRAVDKIDRVPEGAELRQVRLPEQDRARAAHAPDHLGVRGRHPVRKQLRPIGGGHPRDRDHLLRGERHAVQWPQRLTTSHQRVRLARLLAGLLQPQQDDRVHVRIARIDASRVRVNHFDGAHIVRTHRLSHRCRRALHEARHATILKHESPPQRTGLAQRASEILTAGCASIPSSEPRHASTEQVFGSRLASPAVADAARPLPRLTDPAPPLDRAT